MPQLSNKTLDEWESLTGAPERHARRQPNGMGPELRAEVFGYLALQNAHLVGEAALTRGVQRRIASIARSMPGAPSQTTSSGSAASRRRT